MPFIFSRKLDFLPQLSFPGHDPLEVIYKTKLLGVTITSDLSWSCHINNITKQATKNLWVLLRFKLLGGSINQLSLVYLTRIRSILELAALVFHSGLTADQSRQLEMVQKKSLVIILGKDYIAYETALAKLGLERLDTRRLKLCYYFAVKCTRSIRHSSMFPLNKVSGHYTRNPKKYL